MNSTPAPQAPQTADTKDLLAHFLIDVTARYPGQRLSPLPMDQEYPTIEMLITQLLTRRALAKLANICKAHQMDPTTSTTLRYGRAAQLPVGYQNFIAWVASSSCPETLGLGDNFNGLLSVTSHTQTEIRSYQQGKQQWWAVDDDNHLRLYRESAEGIHLVPVRTSISTKGTGTPVVRTDMDEGKIIRFTWSEPSPDGTECRNKILTFERGPALAPTVGGWITYYITSQGSANLWAWRSSLSLQCTLPATKYNHPGPDVHIKEFPLDPDGQYSGQFCFTTERGYGRQTLTVTPKLGFAGTVEATKFLLDLEQSPDSVITGDSRLEHGICTMRDTINGITISHWWPDFVTNKLNNFYRFCHRDDHNIPVSAHPTYEYVAARLNPKLAPGAWFTKIDGVMVPAAIPHRDMNVGCRVWFHPTWDLSHACRLTDCMWSVAPSESELPGEELHPFADDIVTAKVAGNYPV